MLNFRVSAGEMAPPTGDTPTIGWTVPDFFQEDDEPALRSQAEWLEKNLGLSKGFFAGFLRVPESSFWEWRLGRGELSSDRQEALRHFWRTVLHLLSLMGMDEQRIRGMM